MSTWRVACTHLEPLLQAHVCMAAWEGQEERPNYTLWPRHSCGR